MSQRTLPSTTEPAGSRGTETQATLHPRIVGREFARLFREHGIAAHPAEVRSLADRFCADGHRRIEDVEAVVIAYADPTGETAAKLLDRAHWAETARRRAGVSGGGPDAA